MNRVEDSFPEVMTLKQVAQYLQLAERSVLRMLCRIAGPAGEVEVVQELKQAFRSGPGD